MSAAVYIVMLVREQEGRRSERRAGATGKEGKKEEQEQREWQEEPRTQERETVAAVSSSAQHRMHAYACGKHGWRCMCCLHRVQAPATKLTMCLQPQSSQSSWGERASVSNQVWSRSRQTGNS